LSIKQGGRGKSKEISTPLHLLKKAENPKKQNERNHLELQRHKKKVVASFLKKIILDHNFHLSVYKKP
jgi:hypothetical protein